MKNSQLQKFRKLIMYLWMVVMPITFNWMSPVLIIMAGFEATINLSFIIFSIWFISSLFFGRAYCAYACQWGAIQEVLANQIPKPLDANKKNKWRKVKYLVFMIWIPFIFLGPILAGGYIGLDIFYPNPSSEGSLISFDVNIGQMVFYFGIQILIAVMFTLIGGNRSFCNYGCPMGVFGIIGTKIKILFRYPSLNLKVNNEKCTQCKKCSKTCPMGLDVNEMVEINDMKSNDCILCGSCIDVCRQNVIEYAWKWK